MYSLLSAYTPAVLNTDRVLRDNHKIWWIYTQFFCSYAIFDCVEQVNKPKSTDETEAVWSPLVSEVSKHATVEQFVHNSSFESVVYALETVKAYTLDALGTLNCQQAYLLTPWNMCKKHIIVNFSRNPLDCVRWFYASWLRPLMKLSPSCETAAKALSYVFENWREYLLIGHCQQFIMEELETLQSNADAKRYVVGLMGHKMQSQLSNCI